MRYRSITCGIVASAFAFFPASPSWASDEAPGPYGFEAEYRLDILTGLSGPLKNHWHHAGNLDLRFGVDGAKAWGWDGTRFFVHAIANHGSHPNDRQASTQGIDNVEVSVNSARIFQAWGEKAFLDERLAVLFGLLDLNAEFQVTESSATLIHPTFGTGSELGQTGRAGPSIYPLSSLALRGAWKFDEHITWRAALFDGVPGDPAHPQGTHIKLGHGDGTLLISELSYAHKATEHDVNKFAIGAWRYSSRFDDQLDTDSAGNPIQRKNHGIYVLGERTLWNADADGARGLDAFLRIGWAAGAVNQIDQALGAGLLWRGPLALRPKDKLSFGIAAEHNSQQWRTAARAAGDAAPAAEISYELSYRAVVNEWFALQPDVQWLRNHGEAPARKNAVVIGLRLDITY